MLLTEVFNTNAELIRSTGGSYTWNGESYSFSIDGQKYTITVDPVKNQKLYVTMDDEFETFDFLPKEDVAEVHFYIQDGESYRHELTGTGHQFKVFGIVRNLIINTLKKYKYIIIAAKNSEPSRVKLYNRLAKGHTLKRWTAGDKTFWLISS